MIYRPWTLPDLWRTILHSLDKKPKTFDDLLNIGIDRDKLKEILTAMIKLNMIENTGGLKYSLKKKEAVA